MISFLLMDIDSGEHDVAVIELDNSSDPFHVDGSDRVLFFLYLANIELEAQVLLALSDTGTIGWEVEPAEGNDSVFVKAGSLVANSGSPTSEGSGPPGSLIPEPSAALLFCLGFGVVGTATRRRGMH